MICTLYSHKLGFEEIIKILKHHIPKGKMAFSNLDDFKIIDIKIKGGFFSADSELKISYRERIRPNYQINEEENCPLNQNIKGLYGFANSIPSKNEKIKNLFLQKIQTLNTEFSIIQEKGKTKNLKEVIQDLSKKFDAILFVQADTLISKANGQHFLNKNLNLILDQSGNCEIQDLNITIDSKYYDQPQIEATEDQKLRKERNDTILTSHNIKINRNLPFIKSEKETSIRSAKEIAERVTILSFTNLVAFNNISGEKAIEVIKKYDIWHAVTPKENAFLENPTDELKNQETWKCEGIWTLLWALNIVDGLGFPNVMADLNNVPMGKYPIGNNKNPNDFINEQNETRSKTDILNANDLYYRMDWACVDARINNRQITEVNSGVVYERHYALNWLINYQDSPWDDVSCDT